MAMKLTAAQKRFAHDARTKNKSSAIGRAATSTKKPKRQNSPEGLIVPAKKPASKARPKSHRSKRN